MQMRRERNPPYSLRRDGAPEQDLNPSFLRGAFSLLLKLSARPGRRSLAHHAFYGDHLLKNVVVEHMEYKFRVVGESMRGRSDHECMQPYVRRETQAAFFDFVKLQDPAANNPDFNLHAKADKRNVGPEWVHYDLGPGNDLYAIAEVIDADGRAGYHLHILDAATVYSTWKYQGRVMLGPVVRDSKELRWDQVLDNMCGQAITSGQAVGACGLVSDAYTQGSGPALLAASRFQSYSPDSVALSTDKNVGGLLADLMITNAVATDKADTSTALTGVAQVDMFLCGDEDCAVMADLMYIAPTSPTPDSGANAITIATAYSRFPNSKAGIGSHYMPDGATATLFNYDKVGSANAAVEPRATDSLGINKYHTQLNRVVWSLPATNLTAAAASIADSSGGGLSSMDRASAGAPAPKQAEQWLEGLPTLTNMGIQTRLFGAESLGNADWSKLRIGTYELGNGDCVNIINFVHEWMNTHGWGTSVVCEGTAAPKRTYIFDSYFPQAHLQWPPTSPLNNGDIVFDTVLTAAATGSWYNYGAGPVNTFTYNVADKTVDVSPGSLAPTLICDRQDGNSETTGAGSVDCYVSTQHTTAGALGYTGERPWMLPYSNDGDTADTAGKYVVLPLRGDVAAILAIDITEPALGHTDALHAGGVARLVAGTIADYDNTAEAGNPVHFTATAALLKLGVMANSGNVAGAIYAFIVTIIAIIATYASRKDTAHVLSKALPSAVAVALTAMVNIFAVVTPALLLAWSELDARSSNPSGNESTVTWLDVPAGGYGKYKVVAIVSTSYTAAYNTAAQALMWCNVALACVCGALMVFAIARQYRAGSFTKGKVAGVIEDVRRPRSYTHDAPALSGAERSSASLNFANTLSMKVHELPAPVRMHAPLGGGDSVA
ncbi:hypothetical protein JKP88DRAFT_349501 [Tribonema minus]|uniref:Uncharacterized protein n=1 Tax=Tribonema minus TaxID=303371 RepID=A0A835Z1P0_9STRA|nr:hypothetical protein JKP88DRAFT_349501 [Tribonema minus]